MIRYGQERQCNAIGYSMKILYSTRKLEEICTDEKKCRKSRLDIAKGIKLRHNALETASSMDDLVSLDPGGRWHQLHGDRRGQWAGKLTKNYRIIVEQIGGCMRISEVEKTVDDESSVKVLSIEDYH